MANYMIGIDQSTTTTKAILFDKNADVVARCDVGHKQIYPKPDWSEHNPEEIAENVKKAIGELLAKTKVPQDEIAGISITNQRETTMLWDENGKPVYNAIVWQCSRAASITERPEFALKSDEVRKKTGLWLSPYFSAAKASWIMENIKPKGKVYFGNMDSWVIYTLTGNHVTDCSNASRTQLFNIEKMEWDKDLIALFCLSDVIFPEVKTSDSVFGETTVDGLFSKPIPVAGDMGDSHGALFAQQCWKSGMGKCTFGTGNSIMMNIGTSIMESKNRLNTSVAWNLSGTTEYVFEGTITYAGDTVKWLKNEMQMISNDAESEKIAMSIDSNEGVYVVPAFGGLNAPYWKSGCDALIAGLHRSSGKAHIVRAGLESIVYQIKDIIDPMMVDADIQLKELRVDGGPTHNAFLMQFLADILDVNIITNKVEELSSLGTVYAGGFAIGFFKDREEVSKLKKEDKVYYPTMDGGLASEYYTGWKKAVNMLL